MFYGQGPYGSQITMSEITNVRGEKFFAPTCKRQHFVSLFVICIFYFVISLLFHSCDFPIGVNSCNWWVSLKKKKMLKNRRIWNIIMNGW